MLLTEIDHVAIAVSDLEAAIDYYQRGVRRRRSTTARSSRATASRRRCSRWPTATSSSLTPTRDDSPVAKSIEKRGEGLHHVGYRVDDCAAALEAMVAAGATGRSTRRPGPGSRGTTVAFVHPKGSFGTLIELVQE